MIENGNGGREPPKHGKKSDKTIGSVQIEKESPRACARCGASNGGCRRWRFIFSHNRQAYLCVACVQVLGGTPGAIAWLTEHARYLSSGKLSHFERGDSNEAAM